MGIQCRGFGVLLMFLRPWEQAVVRIFCAGEMGRESKGLARMVPGRDLGRTSPSHALQSILGKGNKAQREQTGVHEESHGAGARAPSLPISRQRISRPWPHWGQV